MLALQAMIDKGSTLEEVQKNFPYLTHSSYKRLAGGSTRKAVNRKTGSVSNKKLEALTMATPDTLSEKLFVAARGLNIRGEAERLAYNSLFGDGCISGGPSPYFLESHAFSQAPYMWMKAAMLGDSLSSLRLGVSSTATAREDMQVHAKSACTAWAKRLRDLFYPGGFKDIMNPSVYDEFGEDTLAIWAMDDGSRYDKKSGIKISIGFQDHYTLSRLEEVARLIESKTGVPVAPVQDHHSFLLRITCKDSLARLSHYFVNNLKYKITDRLWETPIKYWARGLSEKSEELFRDIDHPLWDPSDPKAHILVSRTKARGFPYPVMSKENMVKNLGFIRDAEVSTRGHKILAHSRYTSLPSSFYKNRYGVSSGGRPSPVEVFRSKGLLTDCLGKQIKEGSRYENSNIRGALSYYGSKVASNFNPVWAKYLLEKYGRGPDDLVLDPFSGWGGRMVGASVTGERSYHGIDSEPLTVSGALELASFLKEHTSVKDITVVQGCSSDPSNYPEENTADICIACPPYYRHELYSEDPLQSVNQFHSYRAWVDGFVYPVVCNIRRSVKPGGKVAWVIGDVGKYSLVTDSIRVFLSAGYKMIDVLEICSSGRWDSGYTDKVLLMEVCK